MDEEISGVIDDLISGCVDKGAPTNTAFRITSDGLVRETSDGARRVVGN